MQKHCINNIIQFEFYIVDKNENSFDHRNKKTDQNKEHPQEVAFVPGCLTEQEDLKASI